MVLQAYLPDVAPRAAGADRLGDRARPARRRADQGAHRQGRQPRHGAGRGRRCTAGRRRPTRTKPEVDANYKRMVEYGCRPEHARRRAPRRRQPQPVRRGLRPRCCATSAASRPGSSSRCSRAWPTTRRGRCRRGPAACCSTRRWCSAEDFHSAIAYLVRRLDENTARRELPAPPVRPRAGLAGLATASATGSWPPFDRVDALSDAPRRTQDRARRAARSHGARPGAPFANEPDTDWSLAANRPGSTSVVARWRERRPEPIPLQIGGELGRRRRRGDGRDPSRPAQRRLSLRPGRPRRRSSGRSTRPARPSRPGRRGRWRSAAALLDRAPTRSPGGAAT